MFSNRLSWQQQPNRLSQLLDRHRRAGDEILDLTESNPTRAELIYPEHDILAALSDARALNYEPHPLGIRCAREAVAGYYTSRVEPERILLTASTSEAYSHVFKLLCDPGDEVLVPRPSYPLFEILGDLEGVSLRQYELFYDEGWRLHVDALEALITKRTRVIVVVSPNNPTGSYLKESEYSDLIALCSEHGLALICDEVFNDYPIGADRTRVRTIAGRGDVLSFSFSGLSKVSGLPQMKLGWVVVSGPDLEATKALAGLELIADAFLSPSTPVQWAAPKLLEIRNTIQPQIRARIAANLARLRLGLDRTPDKLLELEGGWYAILQVPRIRSEEEWVLGLLDRQRVLTQPGFFYDFDSEAYLVLSLLTPEVVFAEGWRRIVELSLEVS